MSKNLKITLIATAAFVVAVFALSIINQSRKDDLPSLAKLARKGMVVLSRPREVSGFSLLDQDNANFTPEDFSGHWSIVFFGFTHCPDFCPTTMSTLRQSLELLDEKTKRGLKVYMVSVDPMRDTPAIMNRYVRSFSDDFIGLTGEHSELAKFATQVSVTFAKVPIGLSRQHRGHVLHQPQKMDAKVSNASDYTIDHSTQLIVLNPKGHFHAYLKAPHDPKYVAGAARALRRGFFYQ